MLHIIQVESGGMAEDVMQSSQVLVYRPTLDMESSIKQGVNILRPQFSLL